MPSISVIVPVYQAEKFLRDCVESVRRQTFSDWELLLVDDGCTDGSPALCDKLARKDDRIRVFHKESNSGVSETRNVGLDHVPGDLHRASGLRRPVRAPVPGDAVEPAGAGRGGHRRLRAPEPVARRQRDAGAGAARRCLRCGRHPGEDRLPPPGGPAGPAGVQRLYLAVSVLRRDL